MLKDHNAVTPVRIEPAALRSRVKHSTTALPKVLCTGLPPPSSVCIGQIVSPSPHTDGSSLYALAHLSYTGHSRGTRISFVSEKRTES